MLFRQEVMDQQKRVGMGEVIINQPRIFAIMTTAFILIGCCFVAVVAFGTYTRKETVLGYLAPEAGIAPVHANRGGILGEILVSEGDHVEIGDAIAQLSLDSAGPDSLHSLRAQIARMQSRIQEAELQYRTQSALYDGEALENSYAVGALEADLEQLHRSEALARESVDLATGQWERWQDLAARGLAPNVEVERLRQSLINARAGLQALQRQILDRESQLRSAVQALELLPARRDLALSRARSELIALEQSEQELERAAGYTLTAPIAGRVTSMQATVGQAARADHPIATIMPDGAMLRAYLLVPTGSAGFIEAGQEVRIRVDAFPYQRFGTIAGLVANLSNSALTPGELAAPIQMDQPVYRMSVDLPVQSVSAYGVNQPLQSGMLLSADVIVDQRPLWRWFVDPVLAGRG